MQHAATSQSRCISPEVLQFSPDMRSPTGAYISIRGGNWSEIPCLDASRCVFPFRGRGPVSNRFQRRRPRRSSATGCFRRPLPSTIQASCRDGAADGRYFKTGDDPSVNSAIFPPSIRKTHYRGFRGLVLAHLHAPLRARWADYDGREWLPEYGDHIQISRV